jgi:hypothetical protein
MVAYRLGVLALPCYKTEMPKIIEQWVLFKYVDGQFTPLSKPFKTKDQAENQCLKLRERERRSVAVGYFCFLQWGFRPGGLFGL